jgi:hypothetical protein
MTPAEESKRPKTITFYPDTDILEWWNSLAPQTGSRLINELIRNGLAIHAIQESSAAFAESTKPARARTIFDGLREKAATWGVAEPPIEQSALFMSNLQADGHTIFSASPVMRGAGSLKLVVVWKIKPAAGAIN